MGADGFTLSDGKFVDVTDYEAVRDVGAVDGFFCSEVVVVANAGWTGVGPAVVAFDIVDELRKRVGSKHAESGMEAVRVSKLKSVVVGIADRCSLILNATKLRERT